MKSIWYFVGLILVVMGLIVLLAGFMLYFNPPAKITVLASTHPNFWWGGIMVAFGGLFILKNKKVRQ